MRGDLFEALDFLLKHDLLEQAKLTQVQLQRCSAACVELAPRMLDILSRLRDDGTLGFVRRADEAREHVKRTADQGRSVDGVDNRLQWAITWMAEHHDDVALVVTARHTEKLKGRLRALCHRLGKDK